MSIDESEENTDFPDEQDSETFPEDESLPVLEPEILEDDEDPESGDADGDPEDPSRQLPVLSKGTSVARVDPLTAYINELRQYPELSEEEEHEIAKMYQDTGDVNSAYRLITHNLMLVVKIAMGFRREWENMMDLVQEGNVGLMKAVQHFDPFRGVRLPAYASWWIKAYILKFILDNWRLVKVGTTNTRRKLLYNLRKEKEKLEAMGIDPTSKRLAESFGVDEKEVIDVQASLGASDVSMDMPTHPDSTMTPMKSLTDGSDPGDDVEYQQFHEALREQIEDFTVDLKPIERDLLATRILSEDPRSLKEIGEDYNITREAVRQAEQRLLKKFKIYLMEHFPEAADYFTD